MFPFNHPGRLVAQQAAVTKAAKVINSLEEFSPEAPVDYRLIKAAVQAALLIAADEAGIRATADLLDFSDNEAEDAIFQAIRPRRLEGDSVSDSVKRGYILMRDVHQTAKKIVLIARRLYPELSADELAQCSLVRNSVKAAILLLNMEEVSFGNEELMEKAEQEADEIIGLSVNEEFNKGELPDLSAAKDAAIQEAKGALQLAQEAYPRMMPQELWSDSLVVGNVRRAYLEALKEHNIEISDPVRDAMRYHVADAIYEALYPES